MKSSSCVKVQISCESPLTAVAKSPGKLSLVTWAQTTPAGSIFASERTLLVTHVSRAVRTSRRMAWNVTGVFAGSTVSALELLMMNTLYCLTVLPRLCLFWFLVLHESAFRHKSKRWCHEALQTDLQSIDSKLCELHSNISEVAKNLGTQIDKHQKRDKRLFKIILRQYTYYKLNRGLDSGLPYTDGER